MIVLKIIGWVLLGLLALILLALCVRLRFDIEYSRENTSAVLRWLFLKFKLYPKAEKEKSPAEEEEEEKEEEEEEKKEEKKEKGNLLKTLYEAEGIDGLISLLQQTLAYTNTFLSNLLHGFVIDELYLDVRCTKSDAAATAIYYGEVCALLFPMIGALAAKCRMKKYDINVYPDYIARFSDTNLRTSFHCTPIYLVGILLAYVFKLLFGVLIKVIVKISGSKNKNNGNRNDNKKTKGESEIK